LKDAVLLAHILYMGNSLYVRLRIIFRGRRAAMFQFGSLTGQQCPTLSARERGGQRGGVSPRGRKHKSNNLTKLLGGPNCSFDQVLSGSILFRFEFFFSGGKSPRDTPAVSVGWDHILYFCIRSSQTETTTGEVERKCEGRAYKTRNLVHRSLSDLHIIPV
jgi:hypothetical protein